MTVDDVGLQIGLWGTSSSMVTLTLFTWCNFFNNLFLLVDVGKVSIEGPLRMEVQRP